MPVLVTSLGLWCRSQPSCGGIFLVLFHCLLYPHPLFSREFSAGPDRAAGSRRSSSLHAAAPRAALPRGLC